MSLLFFFNFNDQPATVFCWQDTIAQSDNWTAYETQFLEKWFEWESFTWAQIEASNRTWAYMAGDIFADVATASSSWVDVNLPTEECP